MHHHRMPSQLQYLVWNRFNIYGFFYKRPASMIWRCDYHTSLGLRLLWNIDVLLTHGCIHKSTVPMHYGKGHDLTYKMTMTFKMRKKIISYKFAIDCIFHSVPICHIKFMGNEHVVWGLSHEYVMTHWDCRAEVSNWSVLSLVFSILGMWPEASSLKSVHSLHDRQAITS